MQRRAMQQWCCMQQKLKQKLKQNYKMVLEKELVIN